MITLFNVYVKLEPFYYIASVPQNASALVELVKVQEM